MTAVAVIKRMTRKFTQTGCGCLVLGRVRTGHGLVLLAQTVPEMIKLLLRDVKRSYAKKCGMQN
jgi:hypothetical protein